MGNPVDLCAQRLIEPRLAMTVDVAPQRRHPVQVALAIDVDQIVALAAFDNQGFVAQPGPHLGERMPQIVVVRIGEPAIPWRIHEYQEIRPSSPPDAMKAASASSRSARV